MGDYTKTGLANQKMWDQLRAELPVPYYPNVTVGWDSSPRTVQSDRYLDRGYPWMAVIDATAPAVRGGDGSAAADFTGAETLASETMVTINAWNEWTEGSYLLPDTTYGDGFLAECRRAADRSNGAT